MPGIVYVGPEAGRVYVPDLRPVLLANSLSGTGTPPAADIQAGDIVVLTTKSTLTSGGNTVGRMLLAADVTAHYKEGTPVAGVFGVARDSARSNASGVALGSTPLGGITTSAAIPYPYSYAGMQPPDDATGRSQLSVDVFAGGQVFMGQLYVGGGAITLQHQYDYTLAGFHLSTTGGITTYTIDTGAAAADQCLRIIGPNMEDPFYNVLTTTAQTTAPTVFFEVLGAFEQASTGVVYSTQ